MSRTNIWISPNSYSHLLWKDKGEKIMKNILFILVALALMAGLFFSCTPRTTPAVAPQEPVSAPKPAALPPWEEKWENTLRAAKKEGSIVVYATSVAPALKETISLIKKKYGLNLEVITGRGEEARNKLLQERSAGLFLVDVFISGGNSMFGTVKSSGSIEPLEPALILPEVTDTKVWFDGRLPWGDQDRRIFSFYFYPIPDVGINTDLIKPGEIKAYRDFLDPKWKGKLLMNDPTVTGTGFNGFSSMLFNKVLDLDFYRQLIKQEPVIIRDQRLQVDWLAKAKYPVALSPRSAPMAEYQEAGAPIAWVSLQEGEYLTTDGGNMALVNKAPHPNAAVIFINWLLSKEGQSIMQDSVGNQSARIDIPIDKLDPLKIRRPERKYFLSANGVEKWVLEEQDRYLDMARQIFGPLIK